MIILKLFLCILYLMWTIDFIKDIRSENDRISRLSQLYIIVTIIIVWVFIFKYLIF